MKKKLILMLISMLITGTVLGFFIGQKVERQSNRSKFSQMRAGNYEHFANSLCKRFTHQLKLTNQQQELIKPIVDDFLTKKKALDRSSAPLKAELMKGLKQSIKKILTVEQVTTFGKKSFGPQFKERLRNIDKKRLNHRNKCQD